MYPISWKDGWKIIFLFISYILHHRLLFIINIIHISGHGKEGIKLHLFQLSSPFRVTRRGFFNTSDTSPFIYIHKNQLIELFNTFIPWSSIFGVMLKMGKMTKIEKWNFKSLSEFERVSTSTFQKPAGLKCNLSCLCVYILLFLSIHSLT